MFGSSALMLRTPLVGVPGPCLLMFEIKGTVWSNAIGQANFPGCVTPAVCAVIRLYGGFNDWFAGILLNTSSYPTRNPARITVASLPKIDFAKRGVYANPSTGAKLFLSLFTPDELIAFAACAKKIDAGPAFVGSIVSTRLLPKTTGPTPGIKL